MLRNEPIDFLQVRDMYYFDSSMPLIGTCWGFAHREFRRSWIWRRLKKPSRSHLEVQHDRPIVSQSLTIWGPVRELSRLLLSSKWVKVLTKYGASEKAWHSPVGKSSSPSHAPVNRKMRSVLQLSIKSSSEKTKMRFSRSGICHHWHVSQDAEPDYHLQLLASAAIFKFYSLVQFNPSFLSFFPVLFALDGTVLHR